VPYAGMLKVVLQGIYAAEIKKSTLTLERT